MCPPSNDQWVMEAGWKTRWPPPKAPTRHQYATLPLRPHQSMFKILTETCSQKWKNKTKTIFPSEVALREQNLSTDTCNARLWIQYRLHKTLQMPVNVCALSAIYVCLACRLDCFSKRGTRSLLLLPPIPSYVLRAHLYLGQAAFCDHLWLLLWLWEQAGPTHWVSWECREVSASRK